MSGIVLGWCDSVLLDIGEPKARRRVYKRNGKTATRNVYPKTEQGLFDVASRVKGKLKHRRDHFWGSETLATTGTQPRQLPWRCFWRYAFLVITLPRAVRVGRVADPS